MTEEQKIERFCKKRLLQFCKDNGVISSELTPRQLKRHYKLYTCEWKLTHKKEGKNK